MIGVALGVCGAAVVVSACILLAIAADVMAKSEQVYEHLSTLAFHQVNLPLDRRLQLLHIMKECASEEQPLALYTMTGEKYTYLAFTEYLMETAVQYTLLVSFAEFWHLTSDHLES